jgi:hypothetical protein
VETIVESSLVKSATLGQLAVPRIRVIPPGEACGLNRAVPSIPTRRYLRWRSDMHDGRGQRLAPAQFKKMQNDRACGNAPYAADAVFCDLDGARRLKGSEASF